MATLGWPESEVYTCAPVRRIAVRVPMSWSRPPFCWQPVVLVIASVAVSQTDTLGKLEEYCVLNQRTIGSAEAFCQRLDVRGMPACFPDRTLLSGTAHLRWLSMCRISAAVLRSHHAVGEELSTLGQTGCRACPPLALGFRGRESRRRRPGERSDCSGPCRSTAAPPDVGAGLKRVSFPGGTHGTGGRHEKRSEAAARPFEIS